MNLTRVLRGQSPGRWVVLNVRMDKVYAAGATPRTAVRRAEKLGHPLNVAGKPRAVLMQVPDRTAVCLY